jgi:hypothetical protein
VRYRLGEDGSKEPIPGGWWDSQLQVECSYQRASDGVDRCLPAMRTITKFSTPYYLDAACTQVAFEYLAPVVGCATVFAESYGAMPDEACAATLHVYQIGPVADPSANTYYMFGGECKGGSTVGTIAAVQPLGLEVPAASFVGATGIHD